MRMAECLLLSRNCISGEVVYCVAKLDSQSKADQTIPISIGVDSDELPSPCDVDYWPSTQGESSKPLSENIGR